MAFWMESSLKVRRVEEAVERVSSEVGLVDGRGGNSLLKLLFLYSMWTGGRCQAGRQGVDGALAVVLVVEKAA
jgi:hypothetical protein